MTELAMIWMIFGGGSGTFDHSILTRQFASYQECRAALKAETHSPTYKSAPDQSFGCLRLGERWCSDQPAKDDPALCQRMIEKLIIR